jgi:NTE family protein
MPDDLLNPKDDVDSLMQLAADAQGRTGMCLSGGGYKAAMYHLGVLTRINELGRLRSIQRFSSVSGGSIAAGVLAAGWSQLTFDPATGRATNFDAVVARPLTDFCGNESIDIGSVIGGIASFGKTGADKVSKAYRDHLFGAKTLQDLPDEAAGGPRFTFNATSTQLNTLVRMSRNYIADYRVGRLFNPAIPLCDVVAASSAFPPFLTPMVINLPSPLVAEPGSDYGKAPFNRRLELTDGGVYDNLGLESVWKRCRTLIVSNAGNPFEVQEDPANDWMRQLLRTVSMIHRQAENNRIRTLMMLFASGARDGALCNLRTDLGSAPLRLTPAQTARVQAISVRLWAMDADDRLLLQRHGYSVANAMFARFWAPAHPPATAWPAGLMA